jgi:UDP-N-acetylglucosamine 3-dehydrogenase
MDWRLTGRRKKMGVAILGYGYMGSMHFDALKLVEEAPVVGVWGRNPASAKEFAKERSIKAYDSLEQVLRDDEVEIIDVCTPSDSHADFSIRGLEAGKHVLVEKPMALSLREADRMIDAVERTELKLMVAHVLRFFPDYMKMKEMVDAGAIGEIAVARAFRGGPLPPWTMSRFGDVKRSGGAVLDLSIHDVDFLIWSFDEPVTRVFAKAERLVHRDITAHDFALINMRFDGGGIALVEGSFALPRQFPFTMKIELSGTKGMLQLDNQTPTPVKLYTETITQGFAPETLHWEPTLHPLPLDPFYREIRHFVDSIIHDRKPMTDAEESRKSLEVGLAAFRSAKEHAPVKLPLEVGA